QLVGPFQVPVADAAVTATAFDVTTGEAMAMGERPQVALLDAAASGRLAVGEALTNLASAPVARLGDVKLSANWMAASGTPGEDARLWAAVRAVGAELCPVLGIAIPVGKDSLSMRTTWCEGGTTHTVTAPVSLVISAFAPVTDVRRALTPEGRLDVGDARLLLVELDRGKARLGGSALAQVYGELGGPPPDVDSAPALAGFFRAIRKLDGEGLLLAYHDRSDGGLVVTALEMAFATGSGLDLDVSLLGGDSVAALFAEELGAVVQVRAADEARVRAVLAEEGLPAPVPVGALLSGEAIHLRRGGTVLLEATRTALRAAWSDTTFAMQSLRDDPASAAEEQALRLDATDPGLRQRLTFDPALDVTAPLVGARARPRVAILREQGVNGHVEMAAAFDRAGFEAVDVHMQDLVDGRFALADFRGLAVCGGFSYGDVLGAGEGWAKAILFDARLRGRFAEFFARPDTFTLGVCNGCQMMSALGELVPGAEDWPRFVRNRSEQFEARLSLVRIEPSPSILLRGMEGSELLVAVAHGEGRAELRDEAHRQRLASSGLIAARFLDHRGAATDHYPENPNGSPGGITAFTTPDGRTTILMPHPERVFRSAQLSTRPRDLGEDGPWLRLFRNARVWVG
ncbi:MAG: phosphoribosylformylglycinamidine synthase, partial [Deltaproteobacteria bacterium]|nr:phosphoribosylformylglycinamidine synthase [Deltaproteobacteria bacterium]